MANSMMLIIMSDAFYGGLKIPKLPLPIGADHLEQASKQGSIPYSILTDSLVEYLAENPDETESYRPILARLSYEAGVEAGRRHFNISANRYFKIAKEYDPRNLEIINSLAVSYLALINLRGYFNEHETAYTIAREEDPELIAPFDTLQFVHQCLQFKHPEKAEEALSDFIARVKARPANVSEMYNMLFLNMCTAKGYDDIEEMYLRLSK
ncbi:MAG: hypothetical protein JW750_02285 [Anaerolineaceae bacterium]|nr:hypothetical protein [Anaerolineaceae bacterium]